MILRAKQAHTLHTLTIAFICNPFTTDFVSYPQTYTSYSNHLSEFIAIIARHTLLPTCCVLLTYQPGVHTFPINLGGHLQILGASTVT